ncbi:PTPRT-like protein, partial [Mya arenaria]
MDIISSGSVKPFANQSSQFLDCSPEKAIDGLLYISEVRICDVCSVTSGNEPPEWQLNLGRQVLMQGYRIYGQTDEEAGESSNLDVYVSNASTFRDFVEHVESTQHHDGHINRFSVLRIVQIITINRTQGSTLTICEVKLYYGECELGSYGEGCMRDCHCANGAICDGVTGECASLECEQGWTGSSCNSPLIEVDNEEQSFHSGAVAGGVIGALCVVAAVCGVAFFFYRRRPRKPQANESSKTYENAEFITPKQTLPSKHISSKTSEIAHKTDTDVNYYKFEDNIPGIQIHNLWDYIRDNNKKGYQLFTDEFAKLPTGLVHKHEVAEREECKGKNRYREMYAYDHSRVPLQKEKNDDCDYINASYIDGYGKARKFIASQ